MDTEVVSTLISSLIGGVVVALLNYYLTRKKSKAEVEKMLAEAEKIRAETKTILNEITETVSDSFRRIPETIIYDSSLSCSPFDFKPATNRDYKNGQWAGPKAKGKFTLEENGVFHIKRDNKEGRFYIFLNKYINNGVEKDCLEQDITISGDRNIRISCLAKAVNAKHTLYFSIRSIDNKVAYFRKYFAIEPDEEWIQIDFICELSPSNAYRLRIANIDVSKAPSDIYITNLRITEKSRRITA